MKLTPPAAYDRRTFISQVSVATTALLLGRRLPAAEPAPSRKLGIALLGLGSYSTHQLAPALQRTKFCRLAGVITGTPSKGERWRSQYNLEAKSVYSYETMERVADDPEIDIIYVVTPPGTHRDFVVHAARAGKHVICEKPMAVSVAECDEMIAACRSAKKMLSIGYRLQFEPHHMEMDRLAHDPSFGPFTRMRGGFGFRMGGWAWRVEKKLAGGGPLPDVGLYVIQAACRAAGGIAPIAVTAHEEPKTRPELFREVEETIRWKMEFPGGAICDGFSSYNENANEFRAEAAKDRWLEISPAFTYGPIEGRTNAGPMKLPQVNHQAAQMDDFAQCILENRATPVPGEMGRRDIAIMDAIYKAAATGKRVEV